MTNELKKDEGVKGTEVDFGESLAKSRGMPDLLSSPLDQIKSWLDGAFAFMGQERIQAVMNKLQEMRQSGKPPEDKP